MKKILSLFLAAVLCFSLSACGGGNNSMQNNENITETIASAPFLNLDVMYEAIQSNQAQAQLTYNDNMYKVKVTVMNIGTSNFSYRYKNYRGETKVFDVYMPTDVLATLDSGSHIIVYGKLILKGSVAKLQDAIVVDESNIGEKTFDEQTLQQAIEEFVPFNREGNIDWSSGSAPFFVDNRLYFDKISPEEFLGELSGEWTGIYYSERNTKYSLTFKDEKIVTVSKNGGEPYEWEYAFYGDMVRLPDKSVLEPCEVRKVSENLVVFYADTVDYVPYWVLYK